MMQMLQAANIPLLSDGQRVADEDNPVGYWELELVKKIKTDSSWLNNADCHGVKIISPLMFELPDEHQYKVIVMKRAMPEVLASQSVWQVFCYNMLITTYQSFTRVD
jgi:hypothetical protein